MKKRMSAFILPMAFMLISARPSAVSAEADHTLIWQGHELKLERITIKPNEIAEVASDLFPAEGCFVLALLNLTDETNITEEEMELCGNEFLLTGDEQNCARLWSSSRTRLASISGSSFTCDPRHQMKRPCV